jgi:pimeloyl-ACP methyl ester carboxylesterase
MEETVTSATQQSKPAGSRRRRTVALSAGILACLTAAVLVAAAAATPSRTGAQASLQKDADALVAAAAASAKQPSRPTLTLCSGPLRAIGARCGSIRVPLDRTSAAAGTMFVAFALVSRRDRSRPALGTIVLSSGPIIAVGAEYAQGLAPLRSRRDVLFVDQRGTGRSGVLTCPSLRGVVPALDPRARLLARIGACGRALGPRAGLYGSAAAADDIDAVRAALGLQRLDLWGASYGTYLMTVYAARHPTHVRSIVLHGAYPIDFDPWALDRLAAARRSITLVCARTHSCRGTIVLRNIARLAAQLRSHPSIFTIAAGTRRITARLDEAALARVVYGGGSVTAFGRLPAAAASALSGDLAPLRRLVELTLRPIDESFGQAFAQQCHEYPRVFSYADTAQARRADYLAARAAVPAEAFAPFSAAAWTATQLEAVDSCLQWPNDSTAARPFPSATPMPEVPVLAVTGDLDTNTPTASGREASGQFPRAVFVEIPNVGHTPETSVCAVTLALRFIQTLKANPRACAATGAPPAVAGRAPVFAAQLPLVRGTGTPTERRAVALIVATAADMNEQSESIGTWGAANGLRGGRYIAAEKGGTVLDSVRVVRDATIAGKLIPTADGGMSGNLRLRGAGVAAGTVHVSLAENGHGRVTGDLNGHPVDATFG